MKTGWCIRSLISSACFLYHRKFLWNYLWYKNAARACTRFCKGRMSQKCDAKAARECALHTPCYAIRFRCPKVLFGVVAVKMHKINAFRTRSRLDGLPAWNDIEFLSIYKVKCAKKSCFRIISRYLAGIICKNEEKSGVLTNIQPDFTDKSRNIMLFYM